MEDPDSGKSPRLADIAGLDVEHAMSNISRLTVFRYPNIVDDIFHRFCVGK